MWISMCVLFIKDTKYKVKSERQVMFIKKIC